MNATVDPPASGRRRRRTREDVTQRLREAARHLFAERGYAAATTKEIARLADVSETLLFRYYGGKQGLFDEVISTPFNRLMEAFLAHQAQGRLNAPDVERREFTAHVYELFARNRELFMALLTAGSLQGEAPSPLPLKGLSGYFDEAVGSLRAQYAASGQRPEFDLSIGVRLGFGMIAASVLLEDWLFESGAPDLHGVSHALEHMVQRALQPRLTRLPAGS